jgi:hypothetical protein
MNYAATLAPSLSAEVIDDRVKICTGKSRIEGPASVRRSPAAPRSKASSNCCLAERRLARLGALICILDRIAVILFLLVILKVLA